MPNTYTEIARVTASGSAAVSFTSIPATYTDLVLVANTQVASGVSDISIRVNSDTATNYSRTILYGDGSSAASARNTNQTYFQPEVYGYVNTTYSQNMIVQFMNYSNTTTFKTFLSRANNASTGLDAIVGLWRSTSAINRVDVAPVAGAATFFAAGSTFSLYGIANADLGAAKATGGIITEDANYWYHTFGASGTFTPKQALAVDYLVVAGGGGGGCFGGGGGGGGYKTGSGFSVASGTPLTVTVGGGGAGSTSRNNKGTNGVASVFSSNSTTGGGGGGSGNPDGGNGAGGGSGGGSSGIGGATGAAGVSGEGFAGGSYAASAFNNCAGGGGATTAGGNGTDAGGGNGGNGITSSYSGTSVTYAGGGGGGADNVQGLGGTGGGGAAGLTTGAVAGTTNLGGGGGGTRNSGTVGNGANGGSGIVIVRYAK
jgi:hypothetical protein